MRVPYQDCFHLIEPLLAKVEKPSRYIDHEWGTLSKADADYRCCMIYPDVYEVGLPNQGIAILYNILNQAEGISCERDGNGDVASGGSAGSASPSNSADAAAGSGSSAGGSTAGSSDSSTNGKPFASEQLGSMFGSSLMVDINSSSSSKKDGSDQGATEKTVRAYQYGDGRAGVFAGGRLSRYGAGAGWHAL